MPTARVSSKGQITIPGPIREALGIEPGDELLLTVDAGQLRMRVIKRRRLSELCRALPATRPYKGIDEVRREIRSQVAEKRHHPEHEEHE